MQLKPWRFYNFYSIRNINETRNNKKYKRNKKHCRISLTSKGIYKNIQIFIYKKHVFSMWCGQTLIASVTHHPTHVVVRRSRKRSTSFHPNPNNLLWLLFITLDSSSSSTNRGLSRRLLFLNILWLWLT